jgi:hypothetical protein
VLKHEFANLIALCRNCHGRFDAGEIDRRAMLQYKANLATINDRYGDLERRVLEAYAENPDRGAFIFPEGFGILLGYLIKDGLLVELATLGRQGRMVVESLWSPKHELYRMFDLTDAGREFATKLREAREL